jgi:hypothetical protein
MFIDSADTLRYSFVFPNTAMITATQAIGRSVDSNGIKVFGTALSVLLVLLWIFVFGVMIRALVLKRLLWPDEIDPSQLPGRGSFGTIQENFKRRLSQLQQNGGVGQE